MKLKYGLLALPCIASLLFPVMAHAQAPAEGEINFVQGPTNDSDSDKINTTSNPWSSYSGIAGDESRIGIYGYPHATKTLLIQGHRDMKMYIALPDKPTDKPLPAIILSVKEQQSPDAYSNVMYHLASHGFAVFAPQHLDSINNATNGMTPLQIEQSRIDDIHDTIRALSLIKQVSGLKLSLEYSCIGFSSGARDCLMNSGDMSEYQGAHPWYGNPWALTLISPKITDIPPGYADINVPIMVIGTMENMNIGDGVLAERPETSQRIFAAIDNFDDTLMAISQPNKDVSFYYRSLLSAWATGTYTNSAQYIDLFKGNVYAGHTGNVVQTSFQ